jgi:hypothetical protein
MAAGRDRRSQPELFRLQADACAHLGSPMYDDLLRALADDLEAGGPTAVVLRGHEDDSGPSALALRLVGSIHRLVLAGEAPELAPFYPTTGGSWSEDGRDAVVAFLAAGGTQVRPLLDRAPQTNEVGRAAALLGGLLRLSARWRLPVRLFEIGSSGGLNLQVDRFRVTHEDGPGWGDPASPVLLEDGWVGEVPPLEAGLEIAERSGSDLHPVDPTTEDGRLTLTSYVWPDMVARHERLAGAIALARSRPVAVAEADAASYVDDLDRAPGHLTVLFHSVMWQYVPHDQQERVLARLQALGEGAGADEPLVHLYAEPVRRTPEQRHEFWVCAESWPGDGEREYLGRMAPHGVPVTWH